MHQVNDIVSSFEVQWVLEVENTKFHGLIEKFFFQKKGDNMDMVKYIYILTNLFRLLNPTKFGVMQSMILQSMTSKTDYTNIRVVDWLFS